MHEVIAFLKNNQVVLMFLVIALGYMLGHIKIGWFFPGHHRRLAHRGPFDRPHRRLQHRAHHQKRGLRRVHLRGGPASGGPSSSRA